MTICKLGKYMKYFVEIHANLNIIAILEKTKTNYFGIKTLHFTGTVSLKFAYGRDLEPKRLRNTVLEEDSSNV